VCRPEHLAPYERSRRPGATRRHRRRKSSDWLQGRKAASVSAPDVLGEDESAILRQAIDDEGSNSDRERICLRTRAEFADEVFYQSGHAVGAQIVGFNLPFDLSRLAIRHASARRGMKGGFSVTCLRIGLPLPSNISRSGRRLSGSRATDPRLRPLQKKTWTMTLKTRPRTRQRRRRVPTEATSLTCRRLPQRLPAGRTLLLPCPSCSRFQRRRKSRTNMAAL
jgi:hypothetical protein